MPKLECIRLAPRTPADIPSETVVCLGNFDGVHLGHRVLLQSAFEIKRDRLPGAAVSVFCFREPSTDTLSPTPHLSTLTQKLNLFAQNGVEYVILGEFEEMRDLSPVEFLEDVLKRECHATAAVCGFNYRFGRGGKGDADLLRQHFPLHSVVPEYSALGETVSSTRIRRLLAEGNVRDAAALLSYPYTIESEIVHGKALGQKMGIPTVNQTFPDRMLIPRHGVYITDCEIDGIRYRGVSNVGVHPTVDDNAAVNCETHLLDCHADLYGKLCRTSFLEFLRPEQKFDSLDALRAEIAKNIEQAKNY